MPTTPMYRTRTIWTGLPGFPGVQTLYWDESLSSADQAVAALGAAYDAAASLIDNALDWTIESAVDLVDPVTGNIEDVLDTAGASGGGSQAAQNMSLGTQGLVHLRSGIRVNGREVRGKFYLPGPCTSGNDNGVPSATYVAGLTALVDSLTTYASASLAIYSPTNGQWNAAAATQMSPYWARLRTRQR